MGLIVNFRGEYVATGKKNFRGEHVGKKSKPPKKMCSDVFKISVANTYIHIYINIHGEYVETAAHCRKLQHMRERKKMEPVSLTSQSIGEFPRGWLACTHAGRSH